MPVDDWLDHMPGFSAACHPVAGAGPIVIHGAARAEFTHGYGAVHAEIVATFRPGFGGSQHAPNTSNHQPPRRADDEIQN